MIRFSLIALALIFSLNATAETKPIFVGDKNAILLMQGMTPLGGVDPLVREFYDSIAMDPVKKDGGEGKVMATEERDFSLACGHKGQMFENVTCNIGIKASPRTKIDARTRTASAEITGPEVEAMYEKLAGIGATQPYSYTQTAKDRWFLLEATRDRLVFYFKPAP